jgi:cell division protein FtsI (penicillin-binding protein 3)
VRDDMKPHESVAERFNIRRLIRDARRAEAPANTPTLDWRRLVRRRLAVLGAIIGVWALVIQGRLLYLQVVEHDDLVRLAERQQNQTMEAAAKRGDLIDRHGQVLAYSVDGDAIYAVPDDIVDPVSAAGRICAALDRCTASERAELTRRLSRKGAFAYVKRQATPPEARRVAALGIDGVGFHKESRRYYPNRELASQAIGYVGVDNHGLAGLEAVYDRTVRGQPGRILFQHDARRRALESRVERPATAGATLELTLDSNLQYIVERELAEGVDEHGAEAGTAVVMDPTSGEILAMASVPTFNPNRFKDASQAALRNRVVQNIYEPGSTFKVVTASAALMEGAFSLSDRIDCSPGYIHIGARRISDVHRYGVLPFEDVIVKSSNVGAVKVGLRLGAETMGRYARRFGFGRAAAHEFMGEEPGILWNPARLDVSGLASMAMGYQVSVTPLQMVSAVASIANGGELVAPRIVRAVVRNGRRTAAERQVVRRAVTPEVAATLTAVMEQVVERGTARAAKIDGYMVAAKTGTAEKVENGRYSGRYNASIVGFAPSRAPRFALLVVIDSPSEKGYFGGGVAAPVFKRIVERALRLYGVPPSISAEPPLLVTRRAEGGITTVPAHMAPGSPVPAVVQASLRDGAVPDLSGFSARDAVRALASLGLHARLRGQGVVVRQSIEPGAPVQTGAVCGLSLGHPEPVEPADNSQPRDEEVTAAAEGSSIHGSEPASVLRRASDRIAAESSSDMRDQR